MHLKGSDGLLCERNEVRYSFITQRKKTYSVSTMCRVLGVNNKSYYSYMQRKKDNPNDPRHQELLEAVCDIANASDHTYGSRRMKKALNVLGYPVGRSKVKKLMREAGVQVKYRKKYKVTTDSNHKKTAI